MIARIVIAAVVIATLAGLYIVFGESQQPRPEGFPSGSDIRGLKIN